VFSPNEAEVLRRIAPTDVVLDIGGWACPFNRANFVLDAEPYETRGYYRKVGLQASQGGDREHFTVDTWIRRDICEHTPYPFPDKSIDFVICSHVLEDIRDPLWVCREMVRVGKRGYIEVPSRLAETCRGWEHPRIAGLSHHRWLIDIDPATADIRFTPKYHILHSHWRLSFPTAFLQRMPEAERVSSLFWDDSFAFSEVNIHGANAIERHLEEYVKERHPYPAWRTATDRSLRRIESAVVRGLGRLRRLCVRKGKPA